ncbi:hypothetical protein [uncultured Aquitalea sp.]|uniref:DNA-3-methyladenine glycosylase family protein n=1 Tax=uncultured Aquitalea sp. TaxID=540272 RepID=UPI0025EDAC9B|nr:hypothetical protein [uncultured Aquitalea sp.]
MSATSSKPASAAALAEAERYVILRRAAADDPDIRTDALAALAGVAEADLPAFLLRHAQADEAGWRRGLRTAALWQGLCGGSMPAEPGMDDDCMATFGMTAAELARLGERPQFRLRLPAAYRLEPALDYHGRDPAGPAERREGCSLRKALWLAGEPLVLMLTLAEGEAVVAVEGAGASRWGEVMPEAHRTVCRMLGLGAGHAAWRALARREPLAARLDEMGPPLWLPLAASPWEALCWAIIGQQINLAFATRLRAVLIEEAGQPAGDSGLIAFPTPQQVAALEGEALTRRQFSRSKVKYLLSAAEAVASGGLALDALAEGSAETAERALLALHGVGPWTAHYLMMRGLGFADCVPVGDSGLSAALQRFYDLPARPDARETARLMQPFSPCRSLATALLWQSLSPQGLNG